MKNDIPEKANEAHKIAAELLRAKGLEDANDFIIKAQPLKFLAQYRRYSIFKKRPIFKLDSNMHIKMEDYDVGESKLMDILVDSILHEWWHAIAEFLRHCRNYHVYEKSINKLGFIREDEDSDEEEEQAEDFLRWCNGSDISPGDNFSGAIKLYNRIWKLNKKKEK